MPDNDSRIEEIMKALKRAHPGPWVFSEDANDIVSDRDDHIICDNLQTRFDAHLIANAPEWLRYLLEQNDLLRSSKADVEYNRKLLSDEKQKLIEQNEQQQAEIERERSNAARWYNDYGREFQRRKEAERELQQSREEAERLRGELKGIANPAWAVTVDNINLRKELEQVKAERDDYRKVLEWYGEQECGDWDIGEKSRDIIARYEKGDRTDG